MSALGHVFKTHCDTEVILYAWQQWGESCVEHFRGMFAFALYDQRQECLMLARDRFGIKPLFYSLLPDNQLIFGSELKVLKRHPDLPRQLEAQAVEDYFALGYIPEPKTIYRDVFKLRPGHILVITRGERYPYSANSGISRSNPYLWVRLQRLRTNCACASGRRFG